MSESVFAIAESRFKGRESVKDVPPPILPGTLLVSDEKGGSWEGFQNKMSTDAQFDIELEKWRNWAEPWLENHTPKGEYERPRHYFDKFMFRMQTDSDLKNAERLYTDEGDWEEVSIPDYRGPIGKWYAYYKSYFNPADIPDSERVFMRFEGVDYYAEIFLNGIFIGSHEGFFSPFEFDVTDFLLDDRKNILLVKIGNDYPPFGSNSWTVYDTPGAPKSAAENVEGNKIYAATGLGWDDPKGGWQHCPPGAGIWRPVYLEGRPSISISDIFVRPLLKKGKAEVWVEVNSTHKKAINTRIKARVYPKNFKTDDDEPNITETDYITFPKMKVGLNQYRIEVDIDSLRWWNTMTPYLYTARVYIEADSKVTDIRDSSFGVRSFEMDESGDENGLMGTLTLNGEKVILRGANTMGHEQQCVQKGDYAQLVDDLLIAKMCSMNFLRITQRPVQKEVYDMMDALGVMNQSDLPFFALVRRGTMEEAIRQSAEMERILRPHPSAIMSSLINEPFPITWHKERHRVYYREELEFMFHACYAVIKVQNPDRIIKCCDGDYDPPSSFGLPDTHKYATWHPGHGTFGMLYKGGLPPVKRDWKTGIGEFGNEGLDRWELAKEFYPDEWLPQSPDEPWNPRVIPSSQAEDWHRYWFDGGDTYNTWLEATWKYMDWANKEIIYALRRRCDRVISTAYHLLIDAFPTNWMKCVVDYKRRPKKGYYSLRDAQSDLAVNIRCDRRHVFENNKCIFEYYVLNDLSENANGLRIEWFIMHNEEIVESGGKDVSVPAASSMFAGHLEWIAPKANNRTECTVIAQLKDAEGNILHDYSYTLTVFPKINSMEGCTVGIIGEKEGTGWNMAKAGGATPILFDENRVEKIYFCDSPSHLERVKDTVFKAVKEGAGLILTEQTSETVWKLPNGNVNIKELGNREFLSCKTGHDIVKGFEPRDFFMVYDPGLDRPDNIAEFSVEPEFDNWFSVLNSGRGGFEFKGETLSTSVTTDFGSGKIMINQFMLKNRVPSEPVAEMFIKKAIDFLMQKHE